MLRDFILDAKSGFSGTETNHIRLPSPLNSIEEDSIRGISDGEITIRPEDMVKMFDKSLRRTYELLGEQLQQARQQKKLKMKYVFLVGGFSESPYMYKKIKTFVEKSGGLQTIKPAYAWSAVARGAVLKGLHGNYRTILQRKCRRHYGTSCGPVWNPREHMESDAYIDSYDGIKRANGQMKWLFRKGQELPTTGTAHAISHFKKDFWADEKKSTSITLYRSEINDAPQRKSHQDVYEVSTVAVDFSRVPEKEFTIKRSPSGKLYHELNYEVHISIQSSLEFSLVVNGKTYGSLIATYD